MYKNEMQWLDFLENKQVIREIFRSDAPSLDHLRLVKIEITEVGIIGVSFNIDGMPNGCPVRWLAKGFDSLQLRFSFVQVAKFAIIGELGDVALTVSAFFNEKGMFEIFNEIFRAEISFRYAKLDLYPYNSNVFEEPKNWHL